MKWMRLLAMTSVITLGSLTTVACDDDDDDNGTGPDVQQPAAPTGVTASANGNTVTVSWNAVGNADSYRAVLSAPGENDRTETTSSTSVDFADLTAGATYAAQVFAVNTAGETGSAVATVLVEEEEPGFVVVTEDILENTTWTSDRVWILAQPIFVGSDCGPDGNDPDCVQATLTIEPGTTILGRTNLPAGIRGAYLVVTRGSQLIADATGEDRAPTADEVIVFTSDQPRGSRDRGDWGGLVINGRAATNVGEEALGEGDSGFYGGNDDQDDSGILRGVRIEFAGDRVTPTDELNGLALQGVGSGTTVSYVQIHHNVDDGIEPYGGTVSVDHLVVTGIGDDSVDGTDGYRGFMQFIVGQQRGDEADNGMELSGNGEDDGSVTPRSTAVIANATMIGADEDLQTGPIAGPNSDRGIEFREASNYRVYNSIFTDFGDAGFCVSNAQTEAYADNRLAGEDDPQTTISFESNVLWNNADETDPAGDLNFEECIQDDPTEPGVGGYSQEENQAFFTADGFNNILADPMLDPSYSSYGEQSAPPAIIATAVPEGYTPFDLSTIDYDGMSLFMPTDGRMLQQTSYPGAVEPGTDVANAWYAGWTVWTEDGSDSRPNEDGN
jgi:hypothetical protein